MSYVLCAPQVSDSLYKSMMQNSGRDSAPSHLKLHRFGMKNAQDKVLVSIITLKE